MTRTKKRDRRTTSDPYQRGGTAPGTRKSRTKPLRESAVPKWPGVRPVSQRTWLSMPKRHAEGLPALLRYIDKHPTNMTGGYADPKHPLNRRIVANVHRINGTLRHPLTVLELAWRLGFYKQASYKECLRLAQLEELD